MNLGVAPYPQLRSHYSYQELNKYLVNRRKNQMLRLLRLVTVALVALTLFLSFQSTALAGGPAFCFGYTSLTPHSAYYNAWCDQSKVALVGYDQSGGLYVARITSSGKVGLTPRFNTLTVSYDTVGGASQPVWTMGFSMNFIGVVSVPGYLLTVVEFTPGNEGFLIWDTKDPTRPTPITGMSFSTNAIHATYAEISSYTIDFDGEVYRILLSLNRSDRYSHLRGEVIEYRLGPTGVLASGRSWMTDLFVDDFAPTLVGNIEVQMRDPVLGNGYHVAYLGTEDPTQFKFIGQD